MATRALELDPSLGEAHLVLSDVLVNLSWDWESAERELKQAISLDPNVGHIEHCLFLMLLGRPQEGFVEARRAEEVDPLSPRLQGLLALAYFLDHQYEKSIEKSRRPGVDTILGAFALAEKGFYSESIELFNLQPVSVASQGHIGYAYARAGNRAEAERILQQCNAKPGKKGWELTKSHSSTGYSERRMMRFKWLEIAFQQHDAGLKFLKIDPCLDPLRSDPRFNVMVRRVGLTP
jgi:tetratricopeptide (TPR) repeat protein